MTVTVTPTVELSNVPPRVRLDVAASAGETSTTVLRNDPDGQQRTVRTNDGNPLALTGGTGLLYDYEAPFGQLVGYTSLESPGTVSAGVSVDETRAWFIHPGIPSLSQPIVASAVGDRSRRVVRGVFYPMGRKYPVVQTDGQRKAAEYTLTLLTDTHPDRQEFEDLFDDAGVLLLNVPVSKGWGIGAEYVSIGDLTEHRVTRWVGQSDRTWELPLIVVDQPVGGSQAQRTFNDVLADYATFSAVRAAYPTFAALLAGP